MGPAFSEGGHFCVPIASSGQGTEGSGSGSVPLRIPRPLPPEQRGHLYVHRPWLPACQGLPALEQRKVTNQGQVSLGREERGTTNVPPSWVPPGDSPGHKLVPLTRREGGVEFYQLILKVFPQYQITLVKIKALILVHPQNH